MRNNDQFEAIQSRDDTSAAVAAENKLKKKYRDRLRRESREVEAEVRSLIREIEHELVEGESYRTEEKLSTLHWYLWLDESQSDILSPANDTLDHQYKVAFRRFHSDRERGLRPDPRVEYKVLAEVAEAQGHVSGIIDPTPYTPVRLETLDDSGASQSVDDPRPIGRRRLPAASSADPENREVVIPHQSCDHILAVAEPRQGKDSTLTSIGMNLWREHGYSYFSILDDGRMETPMIAIPNDESVIRQNLGRFGQKPTAFGAKVYVPRMEGLPDELPANFEVFTISIDTLTPHLILRLAGVTKNDPTTEQRIKQALDTTLERSGQVDELVARLMSYAEEMEATIEWTEKRDSQSGEGAVETFSTQFQMEREKAVKTAAQRLGQLAGEGLITSPDASTNISMPDVLADQEHAAVLCCNFLQSGQEGLKYTIMDLWLQLIFRARDNHPRLPRACLEIRELKNIAPSQLTKARYKDAISALRQTLYTIASQGGSRRLMLLGSTQKLNDVYKPVRNNMATKVFLKLDNEQIYFLSKSYDFSERQEEQLEEFGKGEGMVFAGGGQYWPIEFRAAPCGLGLGDKHWLDRYAQAWGARVRESKYDGWTGDRASPDYWVDVVEYDILDTDDQTPDVGDWYLLPEDFFNCVRDGPAAFTNRLVDWTLRQRREYPVRSDLHLDPTGFEDRQREIQLRKTDREETIDEIGKRHDVPLALRPWLKKQRKTRKNALKACEAVMEHDLATTGEIAEYCPDWSASTFRTHKSDDRLLKPCLKEDGQSYELTALGEQALDINWRHITDAEDL